MVDNGTDTSVRGKGWTVTADTGRKVNAVGFDKKAAVKKNLPVVSAVGAVDIDNETVLIQMNEAVCNETCHHSLTGEFQMREQVKKVDTVCKQFHEGQVIIINDGS